MTKEEIMECLKMLYEKLGRKGFCGELCLYGGAVMCLAFNAREATEDVDAVFVPASAIRE